MPNGTYGGVRGRKTEVGRKLSFSSYSIVLDRDSLRQSSVSSPGILAAFAIPGVL